MARIVPPVHFRDTSSPGFVEWFSRFYEIFRLRPARSAAHAAIAPALAGTPAEGFINAELKVPVRKGQLVTIYGAAGVHSPTGEARCKVILQVDYTDVFITFSSARTVAGNHIYMGVVRYIMKSDKSYDKLNVRIVLREVYSVHRLLPCVLLVRVF